MTEVNTTPDEIKDALTKLEVTNDAHWTDDGLPRVSAIQELLKDPTITRKMVSEAHLGFGRATVNDVQEPEDVQPGDPDRVDCVLSPQHEDGLNLNPKDPLSDLSQLSDEQVRTIMERRIMAAQERYEDSLRETQAAHEREKKCLQWLERAKADMNRVFPPMHASDAIKQHIDAQLRMRYINAGIAPPDGLGAPASALPGIVRPHVSDIDAIMSGRKRQGRVYQTRSA